MSDPREIALLAELGQLDQAQLRRLADWLDQGRPVLVDDVRTYAPSDVEGAPGYYSAMAIACGWSDKSPLHGPKHPEVIAAAEGRRPQVDDHEALVERSLLEMQDYQVTPPVPLQLHLTAGVEGAFYSGNRARADLRDAAGKTLARKIAETDVAKAVKDRIDQDARARKLAALTGVARPIERKPK